MAAFLAWVYAQYTKVYDWFSDAYWQLREAAASAWSWAVDQAWQAYNRARSYAYDLYRNLIDDIVGLSSWIDWQLARLRQQIDALQSLTWDDIQAWIDARLHDLQSLVDSLRVAVADLGQRLHDDLMAWIDARLADAQRYVGEHYGWLLDLRKQISDVISTLTPSRIIALIDLLDKRYADIVAFLSNPTGWIFDHLRESAVSAACYIIAWQLGATQSDLPTTPPWKE